jgi:hypothetical protein
MQASSIFQARALALRAGTALLGRQDRRGEASLRLARLALP